MHAIVVEEAWKDTEGNQDEIMSIGDSGRNNLTVRGTIEIRAKEALRQTTGDKTPDNIRGI